MRRQTDASLLPRRLVVLGGTTSYSDCAAAARLLGMPWALIRGRCIDEYEQEFAQIIEVAHAFSFSSGRVGLYGLLRAMGVGRGDEILLQVPTHIVVPNAIRYTGARPVFVDCELDSYNMDFDVAERRVSPRTKAIVVQHTFGIPADMDAALDFGRRHGLDVIEDCVHALGATYNGRPVGSLGRASFYSTEATKTINSVMGGIAATSDPDLARRLSEFQVKCGWPRPSMIVRYLLQFIVYHVLTEPNLYPLSRKVYELAGRRQVAPDPVSDDEKRGMPPPGYEQRLTNAQACLALIQLRRLSANVAHRRAVAKWYSEALAPLGFTGPKPATNSDPSMVRYPLWVDDRAQALAATAPYVALGTWFTSVLEEADSPADSGYEAGSCPNAELAAQHLVNLPTHGRVSRGDVERIASLMGDLAEA